MNDIELLATYRARVAALRELEEQISRSTPTGLKALRGANEPSAAALQLSDGLDAMAKRQREELERLWPQVLALTSRINDVRLYMIVHHYYVLAQTIEQIAERLYVSPRTVARLKKGYLDGLRKEGLDLTGPAVVQ